MDSESSSRNVSEDKSITRMNDEETVEQLESNTDSKLDEK